MNVIYEDIRVRIFTKPNGGVIEFYIHHKATGITLRVCPNAIGLVFDGDGKIQEVPEYKGWTMTK